MALKEITDDSFDSDVLQKKGTPVLVDFWAPWCGPCRALTPVLEEVAQAHADKIEIVKFNTEDNPKTATKLGIVGLPTLHIYQDGELVKTMTGAKPKPMLLKELAPFIG